MPSPSPSATTICSATSPAPSDHSPLTTHLPTTHLLITKISGTLLRLDDDSATLDCAPFEYQVYIAESSRRSLQSLVGQPISLHTIY